MSNIKPTVTMSVSIAALLGAAFSLGVNFTQLGHKVDDTEFVAFVTRVEGKLEMAGRLTTLEATVNGTPTMPGLMTWKEVHEATMSQKIRDIVRAMLAREDKTQEAP